MARVSQHLRLLGLGGIVKLQISISRKDLHSLAVHVGGTVLYSYSTSTVGRGLENSPC